MHSIRVSLVAITLSLLGCEQHRSRLDDLPAHPSSPGASTEPAAPSTATPQAAASADGKVSGRVVETMNSGGYTYAKLDNGTHQVWVAGPETKLAVGTQVGAMDGTAMPGFHSDTLNRTFDELYFINEYAVPKQAAGTAAGSNAATPQTEDLSGAVAETMDAAGYTYARVERGNGTAVWLAGPQTKLAVGSKLGAMRGTPMPNFHSDTLNRTFDQIYFVDRFTVASGAIPNPHASGSAAAAAVATTATVEKVAPAPGGTSVATVFADKAKLAGKAVVVRGKVIKVNNGILGKNWLHVQDGSGTAGTNDLLVTTQATAKVGDIVTARGTLAVDKDFGAGYKYAVLLEDATIENK